MMTKLFVSLFILLPLQSCQNSTEYSFNEVKMAEILCDIHIAEAASALQEGSKKDSLIHLYYKQVYEIHRVEEADFQKDMELLKTDLDKMERIYRMVADSIEKRKSRL